jgi:hypothetical protein
MIMHPFRDAHAVVYVEVCVVWCACATEMRKHLLRVRVRVRVCVRKLARVRARVRVRVRVRVLVRQAK